MSSLTMASLFLAHAGLTALALTKDAHRRQLLPGIKFSRQLNSLIRLAGWVGLGLSLGAAWLGMGLGVGLTQWFGVLSLAALIIILQLSYLPRSALWSSLALLVLALIGAAV